MKIFLFIGFVLSGVILVWTLLALTGCGEIRGVEGYQRVWSQFRKSRKEKIWAIFYGFLIFSVSCLRWVNITSLTFKQFNGGFFANVRIRRT
jgi:hypothetical protein